MYERERKEENGESLQERSVLNSREISLSTWCNILSVIYKGLSKSQENKKEITFSRTFANLNPAKNTAKDKEDSKEWTNKLFRTEN